MMKPVTTGLPRFGLTIMLTGPRAGQVSEQLPAIYHRRKVPQPVIESDQYLGKPAIRVQTPTPADNRFEKPHTQEWMGVLRAFTRTVPKRRQFKPVVAFMDALTQDKPPANDTYVLNCPA